MKNILVLLAALCPVVAISQVLEGEQTFPLYTPFGEVEDIPENAYPYYAPISNYPECGTDEEGELQCARFTLRYAYDEDRDPEDGNSRLDLYFTNEWDEELAPNGKPLLFLLHGGGGSRKNEELVKRAIEFSERGYMVVVPDYTTFRDDRWGSGGSFQDLPCFTERQLQYILWYSVRDIRAVVRRVISFSTTEIAQQIAQIDTESLFFFGVSHGSYVSLQLATAEPADFPDGSVEINGNTYEFNGDLDDMQICEDPVFGLCPGWVELLDYEIRDHIKGLSVPTSSVMLLDAIGPEDDIPTLFFHGTCDASGPYYTVTQKEVVRRNIMSVLPDFPLEDVPCQDDDESAYFIHGSQRVYERMQEVSPDFDNMYTGFISLCEARHNLNSYYGITGDVEEGTLESGILEYETMRFFANILNGENQIPFKFDMDHRLQVFTDFESAQLDNHCETVWEGEFTWPNESAECPKCADDQEYYADNIRIPYYSAEAPDEDRYPTVASVQDLFSDCEFLYLSVEEAETTFDEARLLAVYALSGKLLYRSEEGTPMTYPEFLRSGRTLKEGYYILHFSDGTRQGIYQSAH